MEITPELLIGIGGFLTAALAAISAFSVSRKAAKKDEVTLLREEIARLQTRITNLTNEVDLWQKRYSSLFNYVLLLRTILINNNLEVPLDENGKRPISPETKADGDRKYTIPRGAIPPEFMPPIGGSDKKPEG